MRFAVEKNLPNEYTKLEYLESTGIQWIDTGIKLNNNSSVELDYQLTQAVQSRKGLFGGLGDGTSKRFGALLSPSNNQLESGYGSGNEFYQLGLPDTNRHVIKQEKNLLYFDGSLVHAFDTAIFSHGFNAPLGNFNYTNYNPARAKYYSCKIWNGNTLVRDYIPALRKSDNVAGMYDRVTNTFFTNAGTGSFLYTKEEESVELLNNPKYKQVEYLESTGTQYINTGISGNNPNLKIEVNATTYEFGWVYNYNPNGSWVCAFTYPLENKERVNYGNYNSLVKTVDCDTTVRKVRVLDFKSGFYIDGVLIQAFTIANYSSLTPSLSLFARYDFNSNSYSILENSSYKIYGCKIYDDNTLVRNFIPAIRKSDNKPGMYDTVSGTFFENKGTGEFLTGRILDPLPAKYEELAYVESTGTQYIDTGVNFDCTRTAIEVKTYETSLTQIHSILGDNENNVYFFRGTNNWAAGYNKTVFHLDSYVTLGDNLFKLDKNNLYLNGNLVKTYAASTTVSSSNILLFNRKKPAVDAGPVAIYYCRIWDDGTLIRDFVPCVRKSDNKVGMYDRVNGGFYTNLGSGNFTGVEKTKHKEKTVRLVKTLSNGDLPYGLTEVEYLESTGTQWIDTEYKPNSNTRVLAKFKMNETTAGFKWLFSARSQNVAGDGFGFGSDGSGNITSDYNNRVSDTVKLVTDTEYVIDKNKNICKYNDSVLTNTPSTFTCNYPLYIFHMDNSGTLPSGVIPKASCYYFKIYDNDTLVRDFVPVLDESNVPCMYDKVSKQCFYNKGTGTFTAGRKINYVDYLGSDSTAYVDTAVSGANDNLKIEMGFSYSKFTAYGYLFSNYESESANVTRFCLNGTDTDWGLAYINTRSQNGAIYTPKFTKDDFHTFVLTKTSASIDGDIKTNNNPPVGTENTKNIILFNRGADSYYEKRDIGMRCYYFRVYDNDVLIRDFIPAMDENQVGFMFDKVTHTIYDNKGTGTFSCGDKINPFTLRLIEDVS